MLSRQPVSAVVPSGCYQGLSWHCIIGGAGPMMHDEMVWARGEWKLRLVDDPANGDAWRCLGGVLQGLGDVFGSIVAHQRAAAIGPETPEGLFSLARIQSEKHPTMAEALRNYRRVQELRPDFLELHRYIGLVSWGLGNPVQAVAEFEALVQHFPANLYFTYLLSVAHRMCGNELGAQFAFQRGLRLSETMYGFTADPLAKSFKGQFLHLLGEHEKAVAEIRAICTTSAPQFRSTDYPADMPEKISKLQSIVNGRDIAVFGSGPSLAGFAAHAGDFVRHDLCYFGFNNAPVPERSILERIGRRFSLALMTSQEVMNSHASWVHDFVGREEENLFMLKNDVMEGFSPVNMRNLKFQSDYWPRLFFFRSCQDCAPTPQDPLNIPSYTTLSVVLALAVLGRPRRIFLFGCDGARPNLRPDHDARTQAVYYRQEEGGYSRYDASNADYRNWLARDTIMFDDLAQSSIEAISCMFGFEPPEIYNCSPDSAFTSFPRIDYPECLDLLAAR